MLDGWYSRKSWTCYRYRSSVAAWPGTPSDVQAASSPALISSAENALRINALIRKNSLFVGSLSAAHRDTIALTVLHSCRLQKLVPADYLACVTPALILPRHGRKQNLAAITPAAFKAVQRTAAAI